MNSILKKQPNHSINAIASTSLMNLDMCLYNEFNKFTLFFW